MPAIDVYRRKGSSFDELPQKCTEYQRPTFCGEGTKLSRRCHNVKEVEPRSRAEIYNALTKTSKSPVIRKTDRYLWRCATHTHTHTVVYIDFVEIENTETYVCFRSLRRRHCPERHESHLTVVRSRFTQFVIVLLRS